MKNELNWKSSAWWKEPFVMTVRNRQTLEEVWQLPYSRLSVTLIISILIFFIFLLCMLFAAWFFSPKNLIGKDETTRKLILMNQTMDSLAIVLQTRDKYIQNIQKLLEVDQNYLKNDFGTNEKENKKKGSDTIDLGKISEADKKLRKEIEQTDRNLVGLSGGASIELKEMIFFQPLKGLVTEKYNPKEKHFGTDIVAEKDAPIKSIAEGTVIMASWTDDTGYVMMVQHPSKLISVYKHCSVLLKKTGDFIQAGEILAIIGNTGELTSGPHLHFEMWYEGNPINAEKLINF